VLEKGLPNLKNLRHLSLINCKLKQLPESLKDLDNLELLDLSGNTFEDFPEPLIKIKSLKSLCLHQGVLEKMPDSVLELTSLELLAIFNNNGKENGLYVDKEVVYFPEFVFQYQDIDSQSLISNLYKFKQLKALDLSGAPREVIKAIDFSHFPLLKELGLFNCNLSEVPSSIFSLKYLERLDLGANKIEEFPKKIFHLKKLKNIFLEQNSIEKLPVEVINHPFEEGKVSFPYSTLQFRFGLDLRKNPIKNIPPEIIDQGFGAIKNYFTSLEKGEVVSFFSAKLMLVGRGGVGKTTLLKKLIDPVFQVSETEENSTRGIDITKWNFIADGQEEEFETRIWDFGGQSHYLTPHQFFLTKRSLYLVVWEARGEDDLSFIDWLNLIKIMSEESPVILVMNKSDERQKSIDEAGLNKMFPNIVSFHKVSCVDNVGIDALRSNIQKTLVNLPHINDRLPFTWKYIRNLLERDTRNHITLDQYRTICTNNGLTLEQSDYLSNYLHDLGTIIHFDSIPSLLGTVILNPKWLTNAVYPIVDDNEITERFGEFNIADLKRLWNSTLYPFDKYGVLLKLMEKFSICFPSTQDGQFVVP
ncbi:MAG: COR domain-containing protein, partial [Cyanobacteria bacterium J06649_11]